MELVNLMYKYINKFINSDELVEGLEKLDLTKYSQDELLEIKKLKEKVKEIKDSILNEIDDCEKRRSDEIDKLLKALKEAKTDDKEVISFINRSIKSLEKGKNQKRDGEKLYIELFNLLTQNELINRYMEKMNDKVFLKFITNYISVPCPPKLSQEKFNDLVKSGIEDDLREAIWRLAVNYENYNYDFFLIENYFIEKRDVYYITELISCAPNGIDMSKIISKIKNTDDKKFIEEVFFTLYKMGIKRDVDNN